MNTPISIQGIDTNYHTTSQFIHIDMFIKATDEADDTVIVHICKEFHVVSDLKVNMLINTNILRTEDIDLKFSTDEMVFINHKDVMISMWVQYEDNILHTPFSIWTNQATRLPPFSIIKVSIKKSNISKDCDFVFTPTYKKSLETGREVKAHFFDCDTGFIQVYNALPHTIDIGHQSKLDYISEMPEVHFYKVSKEHKYLVNTKSEIHVNKHRNWIQWSTATVTAMLVAGMGLQIFSGASDFCSITFMELLMPLNDTAITGPLLTEPDISHITKVDPHFKHRFKLGFTAYGTPKIAQQLADVAESFPTIWEDHGLPVDLPKQDWMVINLKEGAEPQSGRVYLVSHCD